MPFTRGDHRLYCVATDATGATVTDEIFFRYQTAPWGKPARLTLGVTERVSGKVTVEASLVDAADVFCLDPRNTVRFAIAGDGRFIDNLGTSTVFGMVQLYNGRARITVLQNGTATISVGSAGLPTVFRAI